MKLDQTQRSFIADKLMDAANYVLAIFVLGQSVTENLRLGLLFLGLTFYVWLWSVSIRLKKGVKKHD